MKTRNKDPFFYSFKLDDRTKALQPHKSFDAGPWFAPPAFSTLTNQPGAEVAVVLRIYGMDADEKAWSKRADTQCDTRLRGNSSPSTT